mgnify:CR=1 FL=1
MGRKNKKYFKTLHQQAYDKLTSMQAFGESKKEAVANGTDRDKIFSFNTYKTYWKHVKGFIKYVEEAHPDCTTLKKARKFVKDWLEHEAGKKDVSAWTIQTKAKSVGKLYGITPDDEDYYTPPPRKREDIKRSRGDRVRDTHFSKTNNDELIKFCQGTGLRRSELEDLKGSDLITKQQIEEEIKRLESKPQDKLTAKETKRLKALQDARFFNEQYYTHVRRGKGGKERFSPIVGKNAEQIIERIRSTPARENVWQHVNTNADIHGYRSDYAITIYRAYARPIKDIPYDKVNKGTKKRYQSQVYHCRKDEAGKKLDKAAMLVCSKSLGHNRIEVVANNYIRGL